MTDIQKVFTIGLLAGFSGKSQFTDINRGSFVMKSSHLEANDMVYHDEWFPGSNGGGQELIKIGDTCFTRVYAGGVINSQALERLGISEKDVIGELIRRIQELGFSTRLFENCYPQNFENWGYSYTVIDKNSDIDVTIAKEVITYNGTIVFIHGLLLSPMK